MQAQSSHGQSFEDFLGKIEAGLRHGLIALFGPEDGRDATAQALLYGWENWEQLHLMDNPAGYLFRVGQTWGRRNRQPRGSLPSIPVHHDTWVEPFLPQALQSLPEKQRVAVVLRHGSDWSCERIAEFMGSSPATVRKNVERALSRLRVALEVNIES
jgi:DNA-directed RNA polymerase specialized sigma24 family protein